MMFEDVGSAWHCASARRITLAMMCAVRLVSAMVRSSSMAGSFVTAFDRHNLEFADPQLHEHLLGPGRGDTLVDHERQVGDDIDQHFARAEAGIPTSVFGFEVDDLSAHACHPRLILYASRCCSASSWEMVRLSAIHASKRDCAG
jgi:hypothetical protein